MDMDKHGVTDGEGELSSEVKIDLDILLECLKFQNKDSSSQKQAVITISSICSYNAAACMYLKESGGLHFILQLAWSNPHQDVREVILFFIGKLVENNVYFKQWLCTASLLTRASSLLQDLQSSGILKKTASYLLLALLTNNRTGQSLARTSNCINTMLSVFRSGLPSERSRHRIRDAENKLSHWSDIAKALCASVNNPQHEENQNLCASVLPCLAESLTHSASPETISSQCSVITGVVSNNAFCQEQFARSGGLSALAQMISRFTVETDVGLANFSLAVTITKTIDVCVTDQTKLAYQLSNHGVVPHLVSLLMMNPNDVNSKLAILITIGHATEECEENQRQLLECHGLPLLVQMIVEVKDEEISKAATFILQSCISLTNTYVKSAINELAGSNDPGISRNMPYQMVDMLKKYKTRSDNEPMYQERGSSEGDLASLRMVKDLIDSKMLQWQSALTKKQLPKNMEEVLLSLRKMSNQQQRHIVSLSNQQNPCQSEEASAEVNQTAYVRQPNSIAEHQRAVFLTPRKEPCIEAQYNIQVGDVKAALPLRDADGFIEPKLPLRYVGRLVNRETPNRLSRSVSCKRKLGFGEGHVDEENLPLGVKKTRSEEHPKKEDKNLRQYPEDSRNYKDADGHSNSQLDLMEVCKEAFDEQISSSKGSPCISSVHNYSQRCVGCIVDSPLNSKSYHSAVQKCKSLCRRHDITMELENRYKLNHSKTLSVCRSKPYNNIILTPRKRQPEPADLMTTPQKTTPAERSSFHQVKAMPEGGVKQSLNKCNMHVFDFSTSDSDTGINYEYQSQKDNKQNKRSTFTNSEVKYLLQGVDKFGHSWNKILWCYPFQRGRTNVQLAKKYDQLKTAKKF